jgi:hypothetical protein
MWTRAGVGTGLTCCQAADLQNTISTLTERVDLVRFRGAVTPLVAVACGRPITRGLSQ